MRAERQDVNSSTVANCEPVERDIKRISTTLEALDRRCDIRLSSDFECNGLNSESVGRRLKLADLQHTDRIADIGHHRHPAETRDSLAQYLKSFASNIFGLVRQAGCVRVRSR